MMAAHIPLDRITGRSPLNVRGEAEPAGIADMAASIAAIGLVQPIVLRDDGRGWEVLEGWRRYLGLCLLRDRGDIPADYPVPAVVDKGDGPQAREASLAANVMRHDLHPVEEFEAYTRLVRDGFKPERIAADFNKPVRFIRQRLALDRLSLRSRAAWRAGRFQADVAEALTLAPDHAAQDALLEAYAPDHWMWRDARGIRRHFTAETLRADSAEAIYVGLDAYVAAGGVVDDNLFEEFSLCKDGALLKRLAREKMQAEGEALMERYGYGFVAFGQDVEDRWKWTRLPKDLTAEERDRLAALDDLRNAYEEADPEGMDPEEAAEAELRALDEINAEIDAIEQRAAQRGGTAAQRATAGILLALSNDGRLSPDFGMVPPKTDKSPRISNATLPDLPRDPTPAKPADIEPEPRKPGMALIQTIDAARTAAFAQLVGERPDLAMILATAVLAASPNGSPLRITVQERNNHDDHLTGFADTLGQLLGPANRDPLVLRTRFAAAVASLIVVRSQGSNTYLNPVANPGDILALSEIVAAFCGGDTYPRAMRDWLDYEAYFKAATRDAIVAAVMEAGGDVNHARSLKKGELVAFAAELAKDKG